jgi:hypothetical protein
MKDGAADQATVAAEFRITRLRILQAGNVLLGNDWQHVRRFMPINPNAVFLILIRNWGVERLPSVMIVTDSSVVA